MPLVPFNGTDNSDPKVDDVVLDDPYALPPVYDDEEIVSEGDFDYVEEEDGEIDEPLDEDETPTTKTKPKTQVYEDEVQAVKDEYQVKFDAQEERIRKLEAAQANLENEGISAEMANVDASIARLKQARKDALAEGDMDAFEAAEDRIDELKQEKFKLQSKPKVAAPATQQFPPEFLEFKAKNKWFGTDVVMSEVAKGIASALQITNKTLTPKQVLDQTAAEIRKRFPEKFKLSPNKDKTGSGSNRVASSGKTFEDLPPDAKRACREFVADKVMTKAEYIKNYFQE